MLKNSTLCDSAIPLLVVLGEDSKEILVYTHTHTHTHTKIFSADFLETRKNVKHLTVPQQKKKKIGNLWFNYIMEYLIVVRNKWTG